MNISVNTLRIMLVNVHKGFNAIMYVCMIHVCTCKKNSRMNCHIILIVQYRDIVSWRYNKIVVIVLNVSYWCTILAVHVLCWGNWSKHRYGIIKLVSTTISCKIALHMCVTMISCTGWKELCFFMWLSILVIV